MPNPEQLRKVQAIAKELKSKDSTLKHRNAVAQAWKQVKADKIAQAHKQIEADEEDKKK